MLAAENSQLFLEPIFYIEDKPIKIVEKLKSTRRKLSNQTCIMNTTISKTRKNRTIVTGTQLQHNIKAEKESNLHDSNCLVKMENTNRSDPLFTPQMEVKCELNAEQYDVHVRDKAEMELYLESDDDKDYCVMHYEKEENDEFETNSEREMRDVANKAADGEEEIFEDVEVNEPLMLLTEISRTKRYRKRKIPPLHNCLETCKHKCTTKYDRQQRIEIFDYYWHLSKEDKVSFIRKHIRKPVIKRLRCKKLRNNCCYFLKCYKIGETSDDTQPKDTEMGTEVNNWTSDDNEGLTKVCRKFFDGTLNISDREIKEAIKDFELKPETIVYPLGNTKNDEEIKMTKKLAKETSQPQQYLDPETGNLTDTKPKKKSKRRKRGEPPPERFPKPINCAIRCKFKCHQSFSEAERKQICDIFWSLDFKRRKDFILSRIETTDVKTPITPEFRKTNRPTRAYQTKFYLRSGLKGENKRVCKHFMLNTLCTNRWFIENAIEFADKTTGAYTGSDRRSSHTVHNKITEDRRQTIRDDINSYPCWIPNKKSKTKYLHYDLSIIKMYMAYRKKCLAEQQKYVSKRYYYRVFHEDFHLSFLKNPHPKKGPGFLLSNPHISNYSGEEVGGNWIDIKGNNLDLRAITPAKRLNSRQHYFVADVPLDTSPLTSNT